MDAASRKTEARDRRGWRTRLWKAVLTLQAVAGGVFAAGCAGPDGQRRPPAPAPTAAVVQRASPYGLARRVGDPPAPSPVFAADGPASPYGLVARPHPPDPLVLPPVTLTGTPPPAAASAAAPPVAADKPASAAHPAVLPESIEAGEAVPALGPEALFAEPSGTPAGAEVGPPPRVVGPGAFADQPVPVELIPLPRVEPSGDAGPKPSAPPAPKQAQPPAPPPKQADSPPTAAGSEATKPSPSRPARRPPTTPPAKTFEPAAKGPGPAAGGPEATVTVLPIGAAPSQPYLVDLATVWRLAGADNPTIGLAEEAVREALARQLSARALLLPSLTVGGNYHNHQGVLQASPGFIRNVDSQSFYYGAGARTLAAESVAFPGVRLFAHLGDAYYEPLAARQEVAVRKFAAQGVQNEVLLEVTAAYLDLIRAEAELETVREGERELAEVTRITGSFARTGQGRPADANRARTESELLRGQTQRLEGEVGLAVARLTGLLSLDPSVRLHTAGTVRPVSFMDPDEPLEQLVHQAAVNRPEVAARTAAVAEAETRVRQERVRPFLPLISAGYSAGDFGGGSNLLLYRSGHYNARSDFDVFAVWTLQNAGVGNHALANRRRAEVGQELALRAETVNQVRREVAEARAVVQAARARLSSADRQRQVAEVGFAEERARIRGGGGRPLEVLDSFRLSLEGRIEYLEAVVAYDLAQFRLFVALGNSPIHREGAGEALQAPPREPRPANEPKAAARSKK